MFAIKAGYKVALNKETGKLEEVCVVMIAPDGVVEIPIQVYLEKFVESQEEFERIDAEVKEILMETAINQTFNKMGVEESDPLAKLLREMAMTLVK